MIDPKKEMKKWEKIPFNRGPREQRRLRLRLCVRWRGGGGKVSPVPVKPRGTLTKLVGRPSPEP